MSQSLNDLVCISLSVKSGFTAEEREKAIIKDEDLFATLKNWTQKTGAKESSLVHIGTCHRIEIYTTGFDVLKLEELWLKPLGLKANPDYFFTGLDALKQLIRTCSSLNSEVLGETQITGQVKDAMALARNLKTLQGGLLDKVFQFALRASKRIRNETKLSQGVVSVAHVAVDGLLDVFDTLNDKNAFVVGAGSMALQCLERLEQRGIKEITWTNRSFEKIQNHPKARKYNLVSFDKIPQLIWEHSISCFATSSPDVVFSLDQLKKNRGKKKAVDPKIILDLGLPRNVDPKIHDFDGFYLRNVDEFKDSVEKNSAQRKEAIEQAESIVEEESQSFLNLSLQWDRAPLLRELFQVIDNISISDHSENEKLEKNSEMEYIIRGIYAKLMHRLVEELESSDESISNQVLETLVRAWRHPSQWQQRKVQAEPKAVPQKAKLK